MMLPIRHHDVNLADWWAFVSTGLRKRDGWRGRAAAWPSGQDMGADRVWEISLEQNGHEDAADFLRWPWRNSLSLSGAAKVISRRIVAYYRSGEAPVTHVVRLACVGREAELKNKGMVAT